MSNPRSSSADCPHCHRSGTVTRPSGWWRAALFASWVLFAATVVFTSLFGPFIMGMLPLPIATGLGLLPFVHARATEPATCGACGKIVPEGAQRSASMHTMPAAAARAV